MKVWRCGLRVLMLAAIGLPQLAWAQTPYVLRVHTLSQNDTLVQGAPGRIVFVADSAGTEPLKTIRWPLELAFSNGHLLGPISLAPGPATVGWSLTPWGAVGASFVDSGGTTNPDSLSLTITGTQSPYWTGTGEIWRITVVPLDTGRIIIDTILGAGIEALLAQDSTGAEYPLKWMADTITVVPSCPSGDLNADGVVDHGDLYLLVRHVFYFEPIPVCEAHADVNCSGTVNSADIMRLIHFFLFADRGLCYTCNHTADSLWNCPP